MNLLQNNNEKEGVMMIVNNHLHTPYSFSAFTSIEQIFLMANKENIVSAGINDFFTTDGYDEFNSFALKHKVYPVFNIEFIGLLKDFQEKGIRINDPNNPGRIYFSGKGLSFPFNLPAAQMKSLKSVQAESQRQIIEMIEKTNNLFDKVGVDIRLDYTEIKRLYAKNLVRERHLAKAIYNAVIKKTKGNNDRTNELFTLIYSGTKPASKPDDMAAVENEIRSRLLKTGGAAFVPEDESAFLSLPQIIEIIKSAGGIPCYPTLLDDAKGNFTDFEKDWEKMFEYLKELNIGCIELIPNRNSIEVLEEFAYFFRSRNFIIALGTEHNSPDMIPLTPCCRNNVPLSDKLKAISYEATCVLAAHQQYKAEGKQGYLDENGHPRLSEISHFSDFGRSIIENYIKK
jgi:hypothetical protein